MSQLLCSNPRHIIQKARTKQKVTPTYHQISRLTDTMSRSVKADLLHGFQRFKRRISPETLMAAWKSGNYGHLIRDIPWSQVPEGFVSFDKTIRETYSKSSELSIKALPKPLKRYLRYDIKNPRLRRYIDSHTGSLIMNIEEGAKRVVRQAIHRTFTKAYTPKQVAKYIKDSIVLDERREIALSNYRNRLESLGKPEEHVDRLVDQYADRLLDQRCATIARTETRMATNQGQLSVWREAAAQDLVDRNSAGKIWIVDGNPCDICEPMDGVVVPLDSFWTLNNGDVVEVPTDSHPNCMCGMELDFGDTQIEEE